MINITMIREESRWDASRAFMDNRSNRVLFVGLGTMGLPMAANLVTAGFSPTDALAAATTTAAQACGTAAHTGRIAAGYDADLLAVTGNPLTDISAIHHVAAVYRHGHRIT